MTQSTKKDIREGSPFLKNVGLALMAAWLNTESYVPFTKFKFINYRQCIFDDFDVR